MGHALFVLFAGQRVARIEHDAKDDRWSMEYDPAWTANDLAFPLSPALPLTLPEGGHVSSSLKRFIEHLLPEGRALDVAVSYNRLAKTNVFGLIRALGGETAGALRFAGSEAETEESACIQREVPLAELDERIAKRELVPLNVWDGRVRMSVAGLQDKMLVYLEGTMTERGPIYLVDGPRLASTHILKPDPGSERTPHLAVNEHFCMSLARRMGLPAAEVGLLRTPRPVLVVRRFDRLVEGEGQGSEARVRRLHIIDACQACDLPVSYKYERNIGNGPDVRHIREGMSFEKLFGCIEHIDNKAAARLTMLRWVLFQFLIGNSDAHGKNFSFYVRPRGRLEPADWYDLVSVLQYKGFDDDLAMAFGDVFDYAQLSPFALADFAKACGIDRGVLQRTAKTMAALAVPAARAQADSADYIGEEREFVGRLAEFIEKQAARLVSLATEARRVKAEYL